MPWAARQPTRSGHGRCFGGQPRGPMNAQRTRGYPSMLFRCSHVFAFVVAGTAVASAQEPAPPGTPPATADLPPPPPHELPIAKVSGRVIDAFGKPVASATVSVEGGTATTTTDRTGKFEISAS